MEDHTPSFKAGETRLFLYPIYGEPDSCPDYSAHSCQPVTIVRAMQYHEEYENMGDPLYVVRATDGWEGEVWESELHAIDYDWSTGKDHSGNSIRRPQ
jgi:hypothetical protein